jgi:hypothetical protein
MHSQFAVTSEDSSQPHWDRQTAQVFAMLYSLGCAVHSSKWALLWLAGG